MARQVVLDETFTPQLREVDVAAPAAGQVRVRVARAGVNFWEIMQRRGRVPLADHRVPGSEGVGVVEALGAGVEGLAPGQRVAWSKVPGSYAEVVVAPASALVLVPDAVSDQTAAALLFQGATAHYLSHDAWPLYAGDTAVVTAAAGGVGVLLTQLLVARGARVIGVVSTPEKVEVGVRAGAAHMVTYGDSMVAEIRANAPDGVAAVYDAVGSGVAEPLMGTLRARGAMVLYGAASGQEADIGAKDLGGGSFFLTRTAGRDYSGDEQDVARRAAQLLDMATWSLVKPVIGGEFPLAEVAEAWDALESRSTVGKLLLVP
ncbi:quinone oxidoreductase [Mycolicibacterium chitae]|uniref:NADPH--quinone reductase n=1 Tax=Mycolicibacterium chitae TaxID=1792 RepID=A0A3S4SCU7_MYCCI|nr:zinc-binding dehydrogenase [Mycolicibacterium chitae]MCV7109099.1 zinc-binding dehydrogenase [Mycolicibacterium chitae]BBZ01463.1 quinone oxidoreductase [Mycolicibacterium chitae]VEG50299.1 NADPH--quinone reductase [Mycolicibacterium chitae]